MFSLSNIVRSDGDPKVVSAGPSAIPGADRLARGLGWFSIGLGLTELLAPRLLTRTLGLRGWEGLVRCFGVREIAAGMLTLSTEKGTGIAGRILGDGLDIAVLVAALGPHNPKRQNVGLALAIVAGVALVDIAARKALADKHDRRDQPRDYSDRSGFPTAVARVGALSDQSLDFADGPPETEADDGLPPEHDQHATGNDALPVETAPEPEAGQDPGAADRPDPHLSQDQDNR